MADTNCRKRKHEDNEAPLKMKRIMFFSNIPDDCPLKKINGKIRDLVKKDTGCTVEVIEKNKLKISGI